MAKKKNDSNNSVLDRSYNEWKATGKIDLNALKGSSPADVNTWAQNKKAKQALDAGYAQYKKTGKVDLSVLKGLTGSGINNWAAINGGTKQSFFQSPDEIMENMINPALSSPSISEPSTPKFTGITDDMWKPMNEDVYGPQMQPKVQEQEYSSPYVPQDGSYGPVMPGMLLADSSEKEEVYGPSPATEEEYNDWLVQKSEEEKLKAEEAQEELRKKKIKTIWSRASNQEKYGGEYDPFSENSNGYQKYGEQWEQWVDLAMKDEWTKEDKAAARDAMKAIRKREYGNKKPRYNDDNVDTDDLYQYLFNRLNGFSQGFYGAFGISKLYSMMDAKNGTDYSGLATKAKAENPIGAAAGTITGEALKFIGTQGALQSTGFFKAIGELAKKSPVLAKVLGSAATAGTKALADSAVSVKTKAEWDNDEKTKALKAAAAGQEYTPQSYEAWNQVKDVLLKVTSASTSGAVLGAVSDLAKSVGFKYLASDRKLQTAVADYLVRYVGNVSGGVASYGTRTGIDSLFFPDQEKPTKEQVTSSILTIALMSAASTYIESTQAIAAADKSVADSAARFQKSLKDYEDLAEQNTRGFWELSDEQKQEVIAEMHIATVEYEQALVNSGYLAGSARSGSALESAVIYTASLKEGLASMYLSIADPSAAATTSASDAANIVSQYFALPSGGDIPQTVNSNAPMLTSGSDANIEAGSSALAVAQPDVSGMAIAAPEAQAESFALTPVMTNAVQAGAQLQAEQPVIAKEVTSAAIETVRSADLPAEQTTQIVADVKALAAQTEVAPETMEVISNFISTVTSASKDIAVIDAKVNAAVIKPQQQLSRLSSQATTFVAQARAALESGDVATWQALKVKAEDTISKYTDVSQQADADLAVINAERVRSLEPVQKKITDAAASIHSAINTEIASRDAATAVATSAQQTLAATGATGTAAAATPVMTENGLNTVSGGMINTNNAGGQNGREVQVSPGEPGRDDVGIAERTGAGQLPGSDAGRTGAATEVQNNPAESNAVSRDSSEGYAGNGEVSPNEGVQTETRVRSWADSKHDKSVISDAVREKIGRDVQIRTLEPNEISEETSEYLKAAEGITHTDETFFYQYEGGTPKEVGFYAVCKPDQTMIAYTGERSNIFHKGHEDAHRNPRYVAAARNAIEEMGEHLRDEIFGEYLAIRGEADAPYDGHALQEEFLCDTFGAYVYDKVFDSNLAWLGCGVDSADLQSYFDLEFDKATGEVGALSVQNVAGETMASSNDPLTGNKKAKSSATSPLTRGQNTKSGTITSTHSGRGGVAETLGLSSIININDNKVNRALSGLSNVAKEIYDRHEKPSSIIGALIRNNVFTRTGQSAESAYADFHELGRTVRISNHHANPNNFKTDDNISFVVSKKGSIPGTFDENSPINSIEAVFRKNYLDANPDTVQRMLHDIALFIDTGEYHDTAGAATVTFSGSNEYKEAMRSRIDNDHYSIYAEKGIDNLTRREEEDLGRIVSETASKMMPDSKVTDDKGNMLLVYHGTDEQFTSFDPSKGRANMDIQGSFFTTYQDEAADYGRKVGKYYLNITNPADESTAYKVFNKYKGQNDAGIKAREELIELGYDGVNNGDEYITFYPEQIKSADPITYDDEGNAIQLTERFRTDRVDADSWKNSDVRFSSYDPLDASGSNPSDNTKKTDLIEDMVNNEVSTGEKNYVNINRKTSPEFESNLFYDNLNLFENTDNDKFRQICTDFHEGRLLSTYQYRGSTIIINDDGTSYSYKNKKGAKRGRIGRIKSRRNENRGLYARSGDDSGRHRYGVRNDVGARSDGPDSQTSREGEQQALYVGQSGQDLLRGRGTINQEDEGQPVTNILKSTQQGAFSMPTVSPEDIMSGDKMDSSSFNPIGHSKDNDIKFSDWNPLDIRAKRTIIDYKDTHAKDLARFKKHQSMVEKGEYFTITDDDMDAVSHYFPDYRTLKKSDRIQKLKDAKSTLLTDLRAYLKENLIDSGYSAELDANGDIYVAIPYERFIEHAVPHERRKELNRFNSVTIRKAADIITNSKYMYSCDRDQHAKSKTDVEIWDYFYIPIKYGEDTSNGVVIAVRSLGGVRKGEHQIYGWKNIKNSLGQAGAMPSEDGTTSVGSSAANNSIGPEAILVNGDEQKEGDLDASSFNPLQPPTGLTREQRQQMYDWDRENRKQAAYNERYIGADNRAKTEELYQNMLSKQQAEADEKLAKAQTKADAKLEKTKAQAGQELADAVMTERWKTAAANREEMEHQLSAQERKMAKQRREALDDQYRKMSTKKRIALQKTREDIEARDSRAKYMKNSVKTAKQLMHMMEHPNTGEGKYIPKSLQGVVSDVLENIDFGKEAYKNRGPGKQVQNWRAAVSNLANAMQENTRLDEEGQSEGEYLGLPKAYADQLTHLANELAENGINYFQDMDAGQMRTMSDLLHALKKTVFEVNTARRNKRFGTISECGVKTMDELDSFKPVKISDNRAVRSMSNLLNIDMLDAPSYGNLLGEAGGSVIDSLMDGFLKGTTKVHEAQTWTEATLEELGIKQKELHDWSNTGIDVKLESGEEIRMTPAQAMEIYGLSRRPQAVPHLMNGGIELARNPYSKGSTKKAYPLTYGDMDTIFSKLSDKQKKLVEKMQYFMSSTASEWGNEVTNELYDVDMYGGEVTYWPIKSARSNLATQDPEQSRAFNAILNASFTKALTPKAKNPIVIDDALTTFCNHISQMANYNGLAVPINDAMRWFNYRGKMEDGKTVDYNRSVKRSIDNALGPEASRYFINLIKDINGLSEGGTGTAIPSMLVSNAKKAAVAAKVRVVIQQPTAVLRSMAMINPKYFVGVDDAQLPKVIEEMHANCPIAWWKSQGNFDIGTGKSIRSIIMGDGSTLENIENVTMSPAGVADDLGWSWIWNAVKREQAARNPDLKGQELMDKVVARFTDVINKTQVIDTVMHRPQVMRSTDSVVKQATAFKSEPIKQLNMLHNAVRDVQRHKTGSKKRLARTALSVLAAMAVNAAVVSAFDAMRRREDGERYGDRYLSELKDNLIDNANLLSGIPYLSDIISMLQGFSTERMDMGAVQDMITAGKRVYKAITDAIDGKESNYTAYGLIEPLVVSVAQVLGSPVAGLVSSVEGIVNGIAPGALPHKKPTKKESWQKELVDRGIDKHEAYYMLQDYDSSTNWSKAMSILAADTDKDGAADFGPEEQDMIAEVLGLSYDPEKDGTLEQWAKGADEKYLKGKAKEVEKGTMTQEAYDKLEQEHQDLWDIYFNLQ